LERKQKELEKESPSSVNFVLKEEKTLSDKKKDVDGDALNFSSFLFSLSSSALMAMGEMPAPAGEPEIPVDMALAKQNIDLLQLISQKTKGNLTAEENHLLDGLLYNLRTKFIECRGRFEK
jgi:hypothetical protein